jgi:hypothetical protein
MKYQLFPYHLRLLALRKTCYKDLPNGSTIHPTKRRPSPVFPEPGIADFSAFPLGAFRPNS